MQAKNSVERRKRILTFAGLYAASVILLFFILSALGLHLSAGEAKVMVQPKEQRALPNNEMVQADSLLHAKLRQLQQSDEVYALLLADSASRLQKAEAAGTVAMYENSFKKAIDSIDQLAANYSGDKATMYKTLAGSFAFMYASRQALKNVPLVATGKPTAGSSQQDMLQWKSLLLKKDNDLARQQAEINSLRQATTSSSPAGTDMETMKTAFDSQQKELNDVKDKYSRLKSENGSLASQLVEYKKAALAQTENVNRTTDGRISSLQQKVQDLNADLYFARIDCNLSRADVQDLISNARQRKELLQESLSMLNSLVASGDAGIQKKAKEKMVRLNHIATTLHD